MSKLKIKNSRFSSDFPFQASMKLLQVMGIEKKKKYIIYDWSGTSGQNILYL